MCMCLAFRQMMKDHKQLCNDFLSFLWSVCIINQNHVIWYVLRWEKVKSCSGVCFWYMLSRNVGPVYDKGKENWTILTNEEIYANIKKPTITETIRLHRLRWFGHVQRMEENRILKRVSYMNLGTTRPRGRPWNRWLDEVRVREDGRMVGGEEWQEKMYDREEWKRLLRTARNHRILYVTMDWLIVMRRCTVTRKAR